MCSPEQTKFKALESRTVDHNVLQKMKFNHDNFAWSVAESTDKERMVQAFVEEGHSILPMILTGRRMVSDRD